MRTHTRQHTRRSMSPLVRGVAAALIAVAMTACASSTESRIAEHQAAFDAAPPAVQDNLRNGRVDIGYTREQVRIALGDPDRTASRRDATGGVTETWVYEGVIRHQPNDATYHFDRYYTDDAGLNARRDAEGRRRAERFDREAIFSHNYPLDQYEQTYEKLRLEFTDGKVSAIERNSRTQ
ncbi:MAG: hypothetical protein GC159_19655 [Phycisphaera sp.]|nr:hypothetical protein [Phycisphaera sp.]